MQLQNEEEQDARSTAGKMLLEAEHFKAAVTAPKGMDNFFLNRNEVFKGVVNERGGLMDDDKFFHITCHVEPAIRAKIERGEFVELEKLLTRDHYKSRPDEGKLEFFNKDGHTYLTPANRELKITNVRRWEQAFRVYAAIYSKANPSHAAEIWQYVYVINTAAAAYVWENVSFYDYTFRQMMSVNPQRSWSKIFNQMWNLAMHEPIMRNQGFNNRKPSNQYVSNGNSSNNWDSNGKKR